MQVPTVVIAANRPTLWAQVAAAQVLADLPRSGTVFGRRILQAYRKVMDDLLRQARTTEGENPEELLLVAASLLSVIPEIHRGDYPKGLADACHKHQEKLSGEGRLRLWLRLQDFGVISHQFCRETDKLAKEDPTFGVVLRRWERSE